MKPHTIWFRTLSITLICLILSACQIPTEALIVEESQTELAQPATVVSDVPGVTDDEIILGAHVPLTGRLAIFAEINQTTKAYFDYINDTEGGVHGRKITYLLADDQYSPPLTVEVVTKLVEEDQIFAMVGGLGTPTHLQVIDYLQERGIPDLFVIGGGVEWARDPVARPTVFASVTNYIAEGAVLGRYVAETYPGQKLGVLFQDDAVGHDGLDGLKRGLNGALEIVAEEGYAVGPPDLSGQVERLYAAEADVLVTFAPAPFLVEALKYARLELGWDAPILSFGPGGDAANIAPDLAGDMVSIGLWREGDRDEMAQHLEFLRAYTGLQETTTSSLYGQYIGELTVEILKRAGPNLTREGLIAAAESVQDFRCSVCLFPTNLSDTDHSPIDAIILTRFDDQQWVPFGDGYSWEGVLPNELSAETIQIVPSPYAE